MELMAQPAQQGPLTLPIFLQLLICGNEQLQFLFFSTYNTHQQKFLKTVVQYNKHSEQTKPPSSTNRTFRRRQLTLMFLSQIIDLHKKNILCNLPIKICSKTYIITLHK